MSHFMDFYLTEMINHPEYYQDWLNVGKYSYSTFLHINNTTNKTIVSKDGNLQNHITFKIFMRRIKPELLRVYAFEFTDSNNKMNNTGRGMSFSKTLFAAIEDVFTKIVEILPDDSIILYASDNKDSRDGIYKLFFKKIEKQYPCIVTHDDMVKNNFPIEPGYMLYGFAKKNRTLNILRGTDILTNVVKKFKK